jgi:hypothetical protein
MKQKARNWQVRLHEEIRANKNGYFVTLSFSDKALRDLSDAVQYVKVDGVDTPLRNIPRGYNLDNAIAKKAVRRFLERWRKKHKKSCRHWLVTELGQTSTERLHIHGLLFMEKDQVKDIEPIWKYGNIWIGDYVNERTVNYIVKYIHKADPIHKEYKPIVLSSPGIGKGYLNRFDAKNKKYSPGETRDYYTTRGGHKLPLPIYYRNLGS